MSDSIVNNSLLKIESLLTQSKLPIANEEKKKSNHSPTKASERPTSFHIDENMYTIHELSNEGPSKPNTDSKKNEHSDQISYQQFLCNLHSKKKAWKR